MAERVLVTGATGKTGTALVRRLREMGVGTRTATRQPRHPNDVRFDCRDASTFDGALESANAVYLVAPTDTVDSLAAMRAFLEAAVAGERRFVLLSASSLAQGGPMMGAVHSWLAAHARSWAVLRPSWFMQNFLTQHLPSILQDGALYSATEDGRVPFIDAEDIAAVAARLLADPSAPTGVSPVLTGPQPLSYDAVAEMISEVAGRRLRHVRLSVAALARRYEGFGLPTAYAETLADMDGRIAGGREDRTTEEVQRWTGRPPNDLRTFLRARQDASASLRPPLTA